MAYDLRITPLALADLEQAVAWYEQDGSKSVAAKWLDGITARMLSLQDMPKRCVLAPESEDTDFEVRQLSYKSHRIMFTVKNAPKPIVFVLRIYHHARRPLASDEFGR